jgi:hypothetical protein
MGEVAIRSKRKTGRANQNTNVLTPAMLGPSRMRRRPAA